MQVVAVTDPLSVGFTVQAMIGVRAEGDLRALGATLGATGLFIAGCSEPAASFTGIDITGADYATGFSLTDHNGQPRTLADFKGKVTVVNKRLPGQKVMKTQAQKAALNKLHSKPHTSAMTKKALRSINKGKAANLY